MILCGYKMDVSGGGCWDSREIPPPVRALEGRKIVWSGSRINM